MSEGRPARHVDLIFLMGPPGAGKSTLGNELGRLDVASYTDLEPKLVELYGRGEEFAKHRANVHQWIWSFYREQVETASLPVVMETTGISGREFIDEMRRKYRVLFVKFNTPRTQCVERVASRDKGHHVADHGEEAVRDFFDHWHREVEPSYEFGLTVTGIDLPGDVRMIRQATNPDAHT